MTISLVLDTNVVLDWLLFADPSTEPLGSAIRSGRVRWLVSAPMHHELEHVLGRGLQARQPRELGEVLGAWARWAVTVEPEARPSLRELRCSDPDDQKFIDLAVQTGATALISRDRAILRLARRAAAHGLTIAGSFDPALAAL